MGNIYHFVLFSCLAFEGSRVFVDEILWLQALCEKNNWKKLRFMCESYEDLYVKFMDQKKHVVTDGNIMR